MESELEVNPEQSEEFKEEVVCEETEDNAEAEESTSEKKEGEDAPTYIIRLRGLPFSATPDDVKKFIDPATVINDGVQFTFSREGRPTGEAFVELEGEEDVEIAMGKHRKEIGRRYVEVFKSKKSERDWVLQRTGGPSEDSSNDAVVRLRGLPFGCSKEEVAQFFDGLEIVPNGITILQDGDGRTSGDGFVQFATPELAEQALLKHKQSIGHRYIEIFKSSLHEKKNGFRPPRRGRDFVGGRSRRVGPYDRERDRGYGGGGRYGSRDRLNEYGEYLSSMLMQRLNRPFSRRFDDRGYGGYGGGGGRYGGMRGGGDMEFDRRRRYGGGGGGGGRRSGPPGSDYHSRTGHAVHMRGIPFSATKNDIKEFFSPLEPAFIDIEYLDNGRAAGSANVDFYSKSEAEEAMEKDKAHMEHRYIELFLNSEDD